MTDIQRKNNTLKLGIFILVVLASGWLGVLLNSALPEQPEGNSLGMLLWLIFPFITMILLRIIGRDWKDMGIMLNLKGNSKWYLVAFAIYSVVTIITVGLAFLFGNASFSNMEINALLTLIAFSVLQNFIKNIFEEFSWRGYLAPKLIELNVNAWGIYLISGLV